MTELEPTQSRKGDWAIEALLCLGILAIVFGAGFGSALRYTATANDQRLAITRKALDNARVSTDSLKRLQSVQHAHDSIAWTGYVAQVRAAGHDSLQASLRRLAARRGEEVDQRIPDKAWGSPFPGDVPSNRDSTCTVALPCAQAASLLASDSLRTIQSDSAAAAARTGAAACSASVLTERLRGDSLASLKPRTPSWKDRALDVAGGAGVMAALVALLGLSR